LQMPVSLVFKGEQAPQAIHGNLRVQISRVSTLQHPKGVGIDQFLIDTAGVVR